jgi:antitoxin MazE
MRARIRKWGNSFAVRIPRSAVAELKLNVDTEVVFVVRRGKLIITPVAERRYRLASLLRGVRPSNVHREVGFGAAVGREAL